LQSWTSTGYFSNSTGSFVTNCRLSPDHCCRGFEVWQASVDHWWLGRFLRIIGWDPCACKSNQLHVHILRFFNINLRHIPLKWTAILLKAWTSTSHSSNSTGSSVTNCGFSPIIVDHLSNLVCEFKLWRVQKTSIYRIHVCQDAEFAICFNVALHDGIFLFLKPYRMSSYLFDIMYILKSQHTEFNNSTHAMMANIGTGVFWQHGELILSYLDLLIPHQSARWIKC
jgi:hypothetical protein